MLAILRRIILAMKPCVYVETSVISYSTNRSVLDVITAGHQATTLQWWDKQRINYDLWFRSLYRMRLARVIRS